MRIKKFLLLLCFIVSLVVTNLFNSYNKPPLFEHKHNQNIIILADINSNFQEIIPVDFSTDDNAKYIIDYSKDVIPILITSIIIAAIIYLKERAFFRYREEKGLYGIILWDKKRVLRN